MTFPFLLQIARSILIQVWFARPLVFPGIPLPEITGQTIDFVFLG
jgi:hypothetical protein